MRPTPAEVVTELARRQLALEKRVAELENRPAEAGAWDQPMDDGGDLFANLDRAEAPEELPVEEGWARREVEPGIFEYRSPLNEKHRAYREQLARSLAWTDWVRPTSDDAPQPLDAETGIPAFIEGGALWLYDYDRDFILWHGPDVLHALVADVLVCGAEQDARELAADLLKDRDQGPLGGEGLLEVTDTFTESGSASGAGFAGGNRRQ